jgi:hypothetical protein
MNEALSSSETSVLTRATRRNIAEDAILHLFPSFKNFNSKTLEIPVIPPRPLPVGLLRVVPTFDFPVRGAILVLTSRFSTSASNS